MGGKTLLIVINETCKIDFFLCEKQISNSLLNILRKDTSCQILKIFPSSCSNNGQMILKIKNLLSKIY